MTGQASAPENAPGSPPLPSLDDAGGFLRSVGLTLDEVTGTRVHGYADLGQDHHTPWGVVHGGVCPAAERAPPGRRTVMPYETA